MDMLKYFEAFSFQLHAQQPRQPPVMHASAAERNLRYARGRPSPHSRLSKSCGNGSMKPRGDARLTYPGLQVIQQASPERTQSNSHRLAQSPISGHHLHS